MNLLLFCGGTTQELSGIDSTSSKSDSSQNSSENLGTAVFHSDKLVGEFNSIETLCHMLTTNQLDRSIITITDPYNTQKLHDIYIYPRKNTKIKVSLINGSPFVELNYYFNARLLSPDRATKALTVDEINTFSNTTNQYLEAKLLEYLYKTSQDLNSDVAGIGKYLLKDFLTVDDWKDFNWEENYKNCTFKVNVNTNVKSSYIISET